MKPFRALPRYNALLREEPLEFPGERGRAVHERFHSGKAMAARLGRMAAKHPEVVVKMLAKAYTPLHAQTAIDYITRDGAIDAMDESGQVLRGKDETHEALDGWRLKNDPALPRYDPMSSRNARLAVHMTLSMPVGADPAKVLEAGRRFALEEFATDSRPGANRPFFLVLHTPATEPDPKKHGSEHPHVHIIVKARNDRGERLRTEPEDLERFREVFAWHLCEQGVKANATSKLERGVIARGLRVHTEVKGRRQNTMAARALEKKHAEGKDPTKYRVLAARDEELRRGELNEPTEAEQYVKAQFAAAREEMRMAYAIVTQGHDASIRQAQQFVADMPPIKTDREVLVEQYQQQALVR